MVNYFIVLIASGMCCIVSYCITNKNFKKIINIMPVFFIMYYFSINKTNFDYPSYLYLFENLPNDTHVQAEYGFKIFLNFFKNIGGSYQCFVFIISFCYFWIFFLQEKEVKEKSFIIFCYMLFYALYDINTIRNTIVVTIIFIILNKNKKRFFNINIMFVASLFHRISYIYILFFYFEKLKIKKYIKLVMILFVGGFFGKFLIKEIINILFYDKTKYYLNEIVNKGQYVYYIYYFFDIITIFLVQNFKQMTKKEERYIKFILFPIVVLPYSSFTLAIISRMYRNTYLIKMIYVVSKLEKCKRNLKTVLILFILILNSFLPLIVTYYSNEKFFYEIINRF